MFFCGRGDTKKTHYSLFLSFIFHITKKQFLAILTKTFPTLHSEDYFLSDRLLFVFLLLSFYYTLYNSISIS